MVSKSVIQFDESTSMKVVCVCRVEGCLPLRMLYGEIVGTFKVSVILWVSAVEGCL